MNDFDTYTLYEIKKRNVYSVRINVILGVSRSNKVFGAYSMQLSGRCRMSRDVPGHDPAASCFLSDQNQGLDDRENLYRDKKQNVCSDAAGVQLAGMQKGGCFPQEDR